MAQDDYLINKAKADLTYIENICESFPSYAKDFIKSLMRESDGESSPQKIRTAKVYALILRKFFEKVLYDAANAIKPLLLETEKDQLRHLEELPLSLFDRFFKGDKHVEVNTILHRLQAVRSFYSFLESEGHIGTNPLSHYKPNIGKRPPTKDVYFHEDAKEYLLNAITGKQGIRTNKEKEIAEQCMLRNIIIILLITEEGYTVADITALDITDYDRSSHTLARNSTDEKIELNERIVARLEEYLEEAPEGHYIIGTRSSFGPEDGEQALFIGRKRTRLAERSVIQMIKTSVERAFGPDTGFTPEKIRKKNPAEQRA